MTHITCPCCAGARKAKMTGLPCGWCSQTGRMDCATALQYAATSEVLGRGGYIAGDHDLETCREMEAQGAAIRAEVSRTVGTQALEK